MNKKFNITKRLRISHGVFITILLIGGFYIVMSQPYRNLKAINPQQLTTFKIYPQVSKPVGAPVEFKIPDSIIEEFFHSLKDFRFCLPSRHSVISYDYTWFLEVSAGGAVIHMACSIPSHKRDIVIVRFGDYRGWNEMDYGEFKSKLLFQWYQKYSYLWLNPPDTPQ